MRSYESGHSIRAVSRPVGLWVAAVLALVLFGVQTAWAGRDMLTVRFLVTGAGLGAAWIVLYSAGERVPAAEHAAPDPASLVLSGLAALSIWPAAWWLMALGDAALRAVAGPRPLPQLLANMDDSLLGLNLQPAVYEILIVSAVVIVPLLSAPLLWGAVRRDALALWGPRAGVWAGGLVTGAFLALTAVQNVSYSVPLGFVLANGRALVVQDITPALLWGAVAVGGYWLLGIVAMWCARLTHSAWAGLAAHGTFVYANFALRDDLARELQGRALSDVAWLTLLIAGVFGAFLCIQVIRFREMGGAGDPAAEPGADAQPAGRSSIWRWLPVALLLIGLILLVAQDVGERRETRDDVDVSAAGSAASWLQAPHDSNE